MISYLLKSALCLTVLLLFYRLVLEREKMHEFNRFYLLGSVLFSFLAPLFIIYTEAPIVAQEVFDPITVTIPKGDTITEIAATTKTKATINYWQWAMYFWGTISLILGFRFLRNIYIILRKTTINPIQKHSKASLVLVSDDISPYTFWNYIFINKKAYEKQHIEEALFIHELTHVTQKHTFDVLLIESLKVVFWFNPLFYFLKKSIQLNHEFIADSSVISLHKNISDYQYLLLNKAAWNNDYYLASNFNYSLTKKRLVMMTTQSSKSKMLLKKIAILPLAAGISFMVAERVVAQQENSLTSDPIKVDVKQVEDLVDPGYSYKNMVITTTDKDGNKTTKKYSELTEEEKKQVPPPPPVIKIKKDVPSTKQLNAFKNSKKYAVWIDKRRVSNTLLNNYKNTDFYTYSSSFIHKNARTKENPQAYQVQLMTPSCVERTMKQRKATYEAWNSSNKSLPIPPPPPTNKKVKKGEKSIIPPPPPKTKTKKKVKGGPNPIIAPLPAKIKSEAKITTAIVAPKAIKHKQKKVTQEKPKTGWYATKKGETLYYVIQHGKTKYFNRWGQLVDKTGKIISPEQVSSNNVIKGQNITGVYQDGKKVISFKQNGKPATVIQGDDLKNYIPQNIKDVTYYLNGKKISNIEAQLLDPHNIKAMHVKRDANNKGKIYITTK